MTTKAVAFAAVRTRIEGAGISGVALRWPNEDNDNLPDQPAAFVYTDMVTMGSRRLERGRPEGGKTHLTWGQIESRVEVPRGTGSAVAETIAEQIAALFRDHSDGVIFCDAAKVETGESPDGNYFAATAVIDIRFYHRA